MSRNMFGALDVSQDTNSARKAGEDAQAKPAKGRRRIIKPRRDKQLAVRIYPEWFEVFEGLADQLNATQAETIEKAIDALREKLNREDK